MSHLPKQMTADHHVNGEDGGAAAADHGGILTTMMAQVMYDDRPALFGNARRHPNNMNRKEEKMKKATLPKEGGSRQRRKKMSARTTTQQQVVLAGPRAGSSRRCSSFRMMSLPVLLLLMLMLMLPVSFAKTIGVGGAPQKGEEDEQQSSTTTSTSSSGSGAVGDADEHEYDDADSEDDGKSQHARLIEEIGEVDFAEMLQSPGAAAGELASDDPRTAARAALLKVMSHTSLEDRLVKLFTRARSPECRAEIATHVSYFVSALGLEEPFPFADVQFDNECPEETYDWDDLPEGMHIGHIQNRTYQPPRNETEYIDDPSNLNFCYGILTHDDANATKRLVDVLYQEGHVFVIHVDGKENSEGTYQELVEYASTRPYVHVLPKRRRVRVSWGGFSMVNATLQILQYAFAVDALDDEPDRPLEFHKFFHIASTSYPLASNAEIRRRIADHPLDANFFNVILKPQRPNPSSWFYFVECDDALHRIHRLPPLRNETAGVDLYTASQWFISSREFAKYLAEAKPGSFVNQFLDYVKHVVVADETFFGTVLRHTEFCTMHHNSNFLHLQFDRWESDLPAGKRDEKKCMMKDPDHCGRSPTVMTVDYADLLELDSTVLFARKFVDSIDSKVKDIVDAWRSKREADKHADASKEPHGVDFEGHGVLIVAKDTINDWPMCLGLGETGNRPKLVSCFHEAVVPTLAPEWATGAVILEETLPHNRWSLGPCTTDGQLSRLPTAEMNVTSGSYSEPGPRCMLKQMDGPREGRCLDTDSESLQPGGATRVYPCVGRWYQFLSIGDGRFAPPGSLYSRIPSHVVSQIHNLGHEQIPNMCLGVLGRGDRDEVDWNEEEEKQEEEGAVHTTNSTKQARNESLGDGEWEPLTDWFEQEVITTQCTNEGAIIEWLFVPFIVEENEDDIYPSSSPQTTFDGNTADTESEPPEKGGSNQSQPSEGCEGGASKNGQCVLDDGNKDGSDEEL